MQGRISISSGLVALSLSLFGCAAPPERVAATEPPEQTTPPEPPRTKTLPLVKRVPPTTPPTTDSPADASPRRAAPPSLPALDGPPLAWREIGRSVENRPVQSLTIGRGAFRVLVIGSIHGDEREGGASIDHLAHRLFTQAPDDLYTIEIVRDMNPDGSARSRRTNARRVDLNRNWPAANFRERPRYGPEPLSEPETKAAHDLIASFQPHLAIVLHSASQGPLVNYDGPAHAYAQRFAGGAAQTDKRWRVQPEWSLTPGSLGSWLGDDQGVPILTVEFDRGQSAPSAWDALRGGFDALLGPDEALAAPEDD